MPFVDKCLISRKCGLSKEGFMEIRPAYSSDLQKINELLKTIEITESNLDAKLSKTHEDSFNKRGGFFVVWSVEKLSRIIEDEKNIILVAIIKEKGKEVLCGFFWCRLGVDTDVLEGINLYDTSLLPDQLKRFSLAQKEKRVFTAVECVVLPKYHGMGVSFALIYEMYQWLWDNGFLFILLDVYIIIGEYIQDKIIELNIPNLASINHIKKYNAVSIGRKSIPEQTVGTRRFKIEANVYLLDLKVSLNKLKQLVL